MWNRLTRMVLRVTHSSRNKDYKRDSDCSSGKGVSLHLKEGRRTLGGSITGFWESLYVPSIFLFPLRVEYLTNLNRGCFLSVIIRYLPQSTGAYHRHQSHHIASQALFPPASKYRTKAAAPIQKSITTDSF